MRYVGVGRKKKRDELISMCIININVCLKHCILQLLKGADEAI